MRKVFCFLLSFVLSLNAFILNAQANRVVKENENIEISEAVSTSTDSSSQKLPVEIKAKAAILMEVTTGAVLMEYNADTKLYPASVTKIMTILLVAEAISQKKISLTDEVTCSENAASKGGSQIWLEPGEVMTVDELLRATVIGSANDAATLLGEFVAGSEESFILLMNERAKELGMKNTHFVNATGLDDTTDEHLTTARDIGIMSCELLKHEFIYDYSTVWMDSLREGKTELVNTNKLVRFYEGTTGLKTGTTAKAGCCVSASAKRDGLHFVAVVMGSENSNDRFNTAKSMLSWGFSNYSFFTPSYSEEDIKSAVPVLNGIEDEVKLQMPKLSPVLIKKGEKDSVSVKVNICEDASAPVLKNQTLGTVEIYSGKKKVAEYKVLSTEEVKELTLLSAIIKVLEAVAK